MSGATYRIARRAERRMNKLDPRERRWRVVVEA